MAEGGEARRFLAEKCSKPFLEVACREATQVENREPLGDLRRAAHAGREDLAPEAVTRPVLHPSSFIHAGRANSIVPEPSLGPAVLVALLVADNVVRHPGFEVQNESPPAPSRARGGARPEPSRCRSLIESAKLYGAEPRAPLDEAARRAIRNPGIVTLARDLKEPESAGS